MKKAALHIPEKESKEKEELEKLEEESAGEDLTVNIDIKLGKNTKTITRKCKSGETFGWFRRLLSKDINVEMDDFIMKIGANEAPDIFCFADLKVKNGDTFSIEFNEDADLENFDFDKLS